MQWKCIGLSDLVVRHAKMQNENEAGDSEAAEVTKQMEECVQNLKVMVSLTKKSILNEC